MNDTKLHYDDIAIVPEILTEIESRSECNPCDENNMLPIFASCMSSVVSMENYQDFIDAQINPVIPRTYGLKERLRFVAQHPDIFVAFSLAETIDVFVTGYNNAMVDVCNEGYELKTINICIDMANGHMKKLIETVKSLRNIYGERIKIMTGNIANPKTFYEYAKAGVDYARCGIGGGNVCSTSSNLGIHYNVFSLLQECYEIKSNNKFKCKIVADGGIRCYRDIQKALIYADYVMIGSLLNKAMESAGETTYGKSYFNIRGFKIFRPIKTLLTYGRRIKRKRFNSIYNSYVKTGKLEVNKEVFGMSTKKAQIQINNANGLYNNLKTSEGLVKKQTVEFNLKEWSIKEMDYLKSAMSYTNSRNLSEFKNSQWIRISQIKYNV